MPKLKKGYVPLTDEEDVAITKAAESDEDNPPLSDEILAKMRPMSGHPTPERSEDAVPTDLRIARSRVSRPKS